MNCSKAAWSKTSLEKPCSQSQVTGDRGRRESKAADEGSHVTRRQGLPLGAVGNDRRFWRAGSGPRRPSPGKRGRWFCAAGEGGEHIYGVEGKGGGAGRPGPDVVIWATRKVQQARSLPSPVPHPGPCAHRCVASRPRVVREVRVAVRDCSGLAISFEYTYNAHGL